MGSGRRSLLELAAALELLGRDFRFGLGSSQGAGCSSPPNSRETKRSSACTCDGCKFSGLPVCTPLPGGELGKLVEEPWPHGAGQRLVQKLRIFRGLEGFNAASTCDGLCNFCDTGSFSKSGLFVCASSSLSRLCSQRDSSSKPPHRALAPEIALSQPPQSSSEPAPWSVRCSFYVRKHHGFVELAPAQTSIRGPCLRETSMPVWSACRLPPC